MKVASNLDLSSFVVMLSHEEALRLHELLSKYGSNWDIDLANALYHEGLSKHYHEKWKKEYDL